MKKSVKNLLEDEMFVKEYTKTFEWFLDKRYKNRMKIIETTKGQNIKFKKDFKDSLEENHIVTIQEHIKEIKLMEDKKSKLPSSVRNILRTIYLKTISNTATKLSKNELQS